MLINWSYVTVFCKMKARVRIALWTYSLLKLFNSATVTQE